MKHLILPMTLIMAIGFLVQCGTKAQKDTIIWGRGDDAKGLDPGKEEDGESIMVCDNIYEPLVTYALDKAVIVPWLAEEWTISDDGLVYTFKLREGVKFHDGTPFNADAVVFSIKRQFGQALYKYWNSMGMDNLVEDVIKIDDSTVQFILKHPSGVFLDYCTMHFMYIVSPEAVKKYGDKYGTPVSVPSGTGAYKFKFWKKNEAIVLEKFDHYWGDKAKIGTLIYKPIRNNTTRLMALKKGEINGMHFPDPESLSAIKADSNLRIEIRTSLDIGYLAMNCSKKPFDDVRIRRAVSHAINKKQLVDVMFQSNGIPAKNPIPPGLIGYNDDIEDYDYNPEKAKELLRVAGYPEGFKTDLWYMPIPRGYMPNGKKVAEIIKSDLAEVGIDAELVTRDWAVYLEETSKGSHSMCLLGWGADIADPDNFFNVLLRMDLQTGESGDQNVAFYKSPELQALLDEGRIITDDDRREELYRKACEIFHSDAPWVPIVHTRFMVVVRNNVRNVHITPLTKIFFNTVEMD